MSDIRALIVDDEPLARRGVRQLLAPYPDIVVVGECRHHRIGDVGQRAIAAARGMRLQTALVAPQAGFELVGRRVKRGSRFLGVPGRLQ